MRDAASRTALAVCFLRAADQRRPAARRIVDDPLAEHFLTPGWALALRAARRTGRWGERLEAELGDGLATYVLARHRAMDDALLAAADGGLDQLLLLGAGYDTRPWRHAATLGDLPIVEIDHPATAARRADCVRAAGLHHPARTLVPIDLARSPLAEALSDGGFRRGGLTFVVWEGVTMYLSRAAVRASLTALAAACGPGSELTLDLWSPPDGPGRRASWLRASPQLLHLWGEPITWGIHPDDLDAFAAPTGWRVLDIWDPATLAARYVADGRRVYPAMAVARLVRP
jgi:methyltransferase (TIGR00027 family)